MTRESVGYSFSCPAFVPSEDRPIEERPAISVCARKSSYRPVKKLFDLYNCWAQSMECTSLFVKIGIDYLQAIISKKLVEFTVLLTATMKGCKWLLSKEEVRYPCLCVQ